MMLQVTMVLALLLSLLRHMSGEGAMSMSFWRCHLVKSWRAEAVKMRLHVMLQLPHLLQVLHAQMLDDSDLQSHGFVIRISWKYTWEEVLFIHCCWKLIIA